MLNKKKEIYILLEKYKKLLKEGEIIKKNIFEFGRIKLTYNSSSIEGNTLTEMETKLVIEDGISIGNKKVVEIYEVKNHAKALDFVVNKSEIINENEITKNIILDIHSLILQGIDDFNAGKYRNTNVRISGSSVILPNHMKIYDLMLDLEKWILNYNGDLIDFASELHLKFVSIHPFIDGNGRVARLLFNLVLLIGGFPIISIKVENREKYLKSLEKAQLTGNIEDYNIFMYDEIIFGLEEIINI
ncbi:MAG: Fic family protein [Candidatus Gracilibacteria bacterium]|nr:Fic family protein [Candidatus Gracilibacteria bacterium]